MKRKETDFEPKSLGDHLRKRRLELRLTQKQVGEALGMSPFTVLNLEKGRTEPPVTAFPPIMRWLGYDPSTAPKSLQERMRAARRVRGWTIVEAAERLGIDPTTWGQWERTGLVPWRRYQCLLDEFLARALSCRSE